MPDISKSDCLKIYNDLENGQHGGPIIVSVVKQLAQCLHEGHITTEQFDQALDWMQGNE
jgi:hypothetical protein